MIRNYSLYLDESGSFVDDAKDSALTPSLVGGLFIESDLEKEHMFEELFPFDSHAVEDYANHKDLFFSILSTLRNKDAHFLLFNNDERLKVVNGDITYLNVISDGIVQLLCNMRLEHPDDQIHLSILIANRQAVNYKEYKYGADAEAYDIIIEQDQYYVRLEEKMIINLAQKHITNVTWTIRFDSARKNKKLMIADLICNTYLTRNGKNKFSDKDRMFINTLYEEAYLYSVFENATIGNLKRLFLEEQYGEMICVISELPSIGKANQLRDLLFQRMIRESVKERDFWFSYSSLRIGQYNSKRMYNEGIHFAENYKKLILLPLLKTDTASLDERNKCNLVKQLNLWLFDTDFYILTMYDHLGNVSQCENYIKLCRERINAINHSWEHIDYYFKFVLRELNCRLNLFEFEEVLERSEKLLNLFINAKELFGLIGVVEGERETIRSELLGKLYGVRLQAYTNMVRCKPELLPEALNTSDSALKEFTESDDITRQYQYRCQLLVEANDLQGALICLLKSVDIGTISEESFDRFLSIAYTKPSSPSQFSLYHYTNVLRYMLEADNDVGKQMLKAMQKCEIFMEDVSSMHRKGHPWNLILWNISISFRCAGMKSDADRVYKNAMKITIEDPDNLTMYVHALSMAAEHILYCKKSDVARVKNAEKEYYETERVTIQSRR